MKIVDTIAHLQQQLSACRKAGDTIGFVPTMGALHEGHLALVKRSISENRVTVVSIFVNPTQFNDKSDLEKYPRTLEADAALLEKTGVTFVFAPSETEMYPQEDRRLFDYSPLDKVMEGYYRPGHFNGVCQIVSKLFEVVKPDRAYFGEKDFQQLAVIREMNRQLRTGVEIVGCPIVREADGLAMSSRNMRLSENERKIALKISQTLFKSCTFAKLNSVSRTLQYVTGAIGEAPGLKLEYFEIVDGRTLQPVTSWEDADFIVGCIAVFCGDVRLIDNIKYKESNKPGVEL